MCKCHIVCFVVVRLKLYEPRHDKPVFCGGGGLFNLLFIYLFTCIYLFNITYHVCVGWPSFLFFSFATWEDRIQYNIISSILYKIIY